jgi:large subunit ribosomal protein L3
MIRDIWGQKIGMTQIFSDNKVMPVTAVDTRNWIVTGIKNKVRDGYDALQVGYLRQRYHNQSFQSAWLKHAKCYFQHVREIRCDAATAVNEAIGTPFNVLSQFAVGNIIDVVGWSKGLGFTGVYKRHGFGGAAKSHGSMMGRRPGSIGFTRTSGEVMRGQLMAGHKGVDRVMVKKINVVAIDHDNGVMFVKGSVPGKSGSLVLVKKA